MQIDEILKSDDEFKYMLLSRLQSDCNHMGHLWGITREYHALVMQEIWNNLKMKPQWLKETELKTLIFQLTGKERV